MRAPFQVLAIPFPFCDGVPQYCVLHRSDCDRWQFAAGGGEDKETPEQAVLREIFEECGVRAVHPVRPCSMCHIPAEIFSHRRQYGWPADLFVIPEYSFGFWCHSPIVLSHEHTAYAWLPYDAAREKLHWDSNKTALYELNCRLLMGSDAFAFRTESDRTSEFDPQTHMD